jgi:hypothetical protein
MIHGLETLHRPMRSLLEAGSGLIFDQVEHELEALGEASPEAVMQMAPRLLSIAGGMGMSAHILSTIAEASVTTKEMGFGHVGAFLVDLAGYGGIAKNTLGVQFDAALSGPAKRRANARFRPNLPGAGEWANLFLERKVSNEATRQFYREQGWAERLIDPYIDALYREASPRDLVSAFTDAELDRGWAVAHLQESGYKDDDAERIARGILHKSRASVVADIQRAVLDNFGQGIYSADDVRAYLAELGIGDEVIQLRMTAALHRRVGDERAAVAKLYEDAMGTGQIQDADLRATLAALGYDERAREQASWRARVRLSARMFSEETSDMKAAVRRVQTDLVTLARERFKRHQIDAATLQTHLLAAGILEEEAAALVQLAITQRTPVPRLAEALSPQAQEQRVLELEADRYLELQRKGVIDHATATASLMALGYDEDRARAETDLIAARRIRPLDEEEPEKPSPEALEVRRIRTDAALTTFRQGLATVTQLSLALSAAGHPESVVSAMVDRELARRRVEELRERQRATEQAATAQRRELEEASIIAFRSGRLDAGQLLGNLVSIGLELGVAQAIVVREEERANAAASTRAELDARRIAAEERADLEAALVEGYRGDRISAEELRDALVSLGLDSRLADATVAREEARAESRAAAAAAP